VITFKAAYYIKLGTGGAWEADCIKNGLIRFGWPEQTVQDMNDGRWDRIESQLRNHHGTSKGTATADINRLRALLTSSDEDIWVTFHQGKLWWARVAVGAVEEDDISRFRRTTAPWTDCSEHGTTFFATEIPGQLSQLQGYRATLCSVRYGDVLRRLLNDEVSPDALALQHARKELEASIAQAIKSLHWKDFETLVDLVFLNSGWRRISVLGQHAKAYDLEVEEPLLGQRAIVQVKSRASKTDLEATAAAFSPADYVKVFFVVHTPSADLVASDDFVEILGPASLAERVVRAGLTGWVEDKVL
jgi:hypothetical protein